MPRSRKVRGAAGLAWWLARLTNHGELPLSILAISPHKVAQPKLRTHSSTFSLKHPEERTRGKVSKEKDDEYSRQCRLDEHNTIESCPCIMYKHEILVFSLQSLLHGAQCEAAERPFENGPEHRFRIQLQNPRQGRGVQESSCMSSCCACQLRCGASMHYVQDKTSSILLYGIELPGFQFQRHEAKLFTFGNPNAKSLGGSKDVGLGDAVTAEPSNLSVQHEAFYFYSDFPPLFFSSGQLLLALATTRSTYLAALLIRRPR